MSVQPTAARITALRGIATQLAARSVEATADSAWKSHEIDTGELFEVAEVEKNHLYLDRDARAYICSSYTPRNLTAWMPIDKMDEGTLEMYIQRLYRYFTGTYLMPQNAHKVNVKKLPNRVIR